MCVPIYRRDPKTRLTFVIANLSLAGGLILWAFVRPLLAPPHAWLDGLYGMLLGFSVTVNICTIIRGRRCADLADERHNRRVYP